MLIIAFLCNFVHAIIKYMNKKIKIIACLLPALVPLAFAYFTKTQIDMLGFPDGYLTDYDQALKVWSPALIVLDILVGFVFYFTAYKAGAKKDFIRLGIYVILYILLRVGAIYGLDWYLKSFLQLNSGGGA